VRQGEKERRQWNAEEVGFRGSSTSYPQVSLDSTIITEQPLVIAVLSFTMVYRK